MLSSSSSPDTSLNLKILNRSPIQILENKCKIKQATSSLQNIEVKNINKCSFVLDEETERREASLIALKLYYLGIIETLKSIPPLKSNFSHESSEMYMMKNKLNLLEFEVDAIRGKIEESEKQIAEADTKLTSVRNDVECLKKLIYEEDMRNQQMTKAIQRKIDECLYKLAKVDDVANSAPPRDETTTVKCNVLPNYSSSLVQFSDLVYLTGKLKQYCQGQYGSALVIRRIIEGSTFERNLVWDELGLPSSLPFILNNENISNVVLVLIENEYKALKVIEEYVMFNIRAFYSAEGGQRFVD